MHCAGRTGWLLHCYCMSLFLLHTSERPLRSVAAGPQAV
jgi:hypothetical protein